MIFLRNYEIHKEVIAFDPRDVHWRKVDTDRLKELAPGNISGYYSILSSKFCAIFKSGHEIILRVGEVQVPLVDDLTVAVTGTQDRRELVITECRKVLVSHEYSLDPSIQFENDPTPFVEEEDFDFGLFLANIAGSKERQEVFKRPF